MATTHVKLLPWKLEIQCITSWFTWYWFDWYWLTFVHISQGRPVKSKDKTKSYK